MSEHVVLYRCELCSQLFAFKPVVMRAVSEFKSSDTHEGCPRKLIEMMTGPRGFFALSAIHTNPPDWPKLQAVELKGMDREGESVDIYTKVGE